MNMLNSFLCHLISVLFICYCETSFGKSYSIQELTVTGKDLRMCEFSHNYCVMDTSDCSLTDAVHSGLIADTVEDFKCHFSNGKPTTSLTCQWKMEKDENSGEMRTSLIFSSVQGFGNCRFVLLSGYKLNITLKIQDIMTKKETLSGPYFKYLKEIVKPSPPVDLEVVASQNSLMVTWTTKETNLVECKIRHKPNGGHSWTEGSKVYKGRWMYVIDNLQPFTLYTVSVSCVTKYKYWSDWSKEWSGMTPESVPSSPSRVCYHIEDIMSHGTQKIHLLWTAIPAEKASGTILSYRVSVSSKHPHQNWTVITTAHKLTLEVTRAVNNIVITAYNTAGESPPYQLTVSAAEPRSDLPSVRGMWVHSEGGKLWVQWDVDPDRPVSEFAVERVAEADPNNTHWTWMEGSGHVLTALTGDIEPMQTYIITVYPISGVQCGPPSSLQASPDNGALVEVADMKVAMVTKQRAAIQWQWQRKQHGSNILQYSLVLSSEGDSQSIMITPDMNQYSFHSLTPNTEYSVHVSAKNPFGSISIDKQNFTTPQRDQQDVTYETITVVIPLLILIIVTSVFSITCRIVYRKYIILKVADPEKSVACRWLMNFHRADGEQKVLKVEDISPTEADNVQVEEKTCLMPTHCTGDNSRSQELDIVMNSKNATCERIDYGGSDASLIFKPQGGSCLTHNNVGYVHSVPFPDVKNIAFKTNIYYVKSISALAQDHLMSSNISSEDIPQSNITSIPQHFKSGYVSDIPTNTVFTGVIPNQPTKINNVCHPCQVGTHYGEIPPTTGMLILDNNSYVDSR
ncbi:hypothetical protein ACEWY4_012669 [Coilia grayii]|uniref:Fibronectin type-III domain-containing protein n=1 Tax=Coilia grayii TaxID=363190 RepID=A0ABD1K170_9TELE